MRGKEIIRVIVGDVLGITPAYAGKRRFVLSAQASGRDHPRICGEKLGDFDQLYLCQGSPPHMRGKDRQTNALAFGIGITPAYAGKSTPFSR